MRILRKYIMTIKKKRKGENVIKRLGNNTGFERRDSGIICEFPEQI